MPENSKTGLHIGAVTADDADKNKTVIYSMEGMPDIVKMVFLDRDNGDITVASKIDHESYTWLNLTVGVKRPKRKLLFKKNLYYIIGESYRYGNTSPDSQS